LILYGLETRYIKHTKVADEFITSKTQA